MSSLIDPNAQNIENTFMPNCRSKWVSVNGIITLLQGGFCKFSDLPKDVKDKVNIILNQSKC